MLVYISGYTKLVAINTLPKIISNGPFRCTATLLDENDDPIEMRSQEITFNLIKFQENQNQFIEWHKDTFKESITVDEYQAVKWVIRFTIHKKDRQILQGDNF